MAWKKIALGSGTSSQYIKGDGSFGTYSTTDSTKLPLSGGTLTGFTSVQYTSAKLRVGDGTNSTTIGTWDGTNNRIESAGRPLLITSYTSPIKLGISGGTTLSITSTTATFSGNVTSGNNFILPSNTGNNGWILQNNTHTGTGELGIQAGAGSAGYGGAIRLYGHSHSTNAGWIKAGISSGSGGKFAVNTSALGTSADVFIVDSSGNGTFSGDVGIGTDNPSGTDIDGTVLEIKDGTNNVGLNINATNTGKTAMIELHADRPSDGNLAGNIQFFNNGATQIAEIRATRGSTDLKGDLILRSSDANRLYIDEDGLVGIGTDSPSSLLHVAGDTANGAYLSYINNTGVQSQDNGLHIQIASSGSSAHGLKVQTGGSANAFIVSGDGQVGLGYTSSSMTQTLNVNGGAYIAGQVTASAGALSAPTYSFVGDTDTGISRPTTNAINLVTAGTERMRITSTGNVGIGMTPTERLDIKTTSGDCRIRLEASSGSDTEIKFFNAGVAQYTIGHDDGTDNFVIGGGNVDDPMVSVNKSGNVGIGRTPSYKLDVNGTLRTTGDATFDADIEVATVDNIKVNSRAINGIILSQKYDDVVTSKSVGSSNVKLKGFANFIAPANGKVMYEIQVWIDGASSKLCKVGVASDSSVSTVVVPARRVAYVDESDQVICNIKVMETGLTAGTTYSRWAFGITNSSTTSTYKWGYGGTTSTDWCPLILTVMTAGI